MDLLGYNINGNDPTHLREVIPLHTNLASTVVTIRIRSKPHSVLPKQVLSVLSIIFIWI